MRRSKTLVALGCVPLWFCGEHLTLIPLCRNHMVSTQRFQILAWPRQESIVCDSLTSIVPRSRLLARVIESSLYPYLPQSGNAAIAALHILLRRASEGECRDQHLSKE